MICEHGIESEGATTPCGNCAAKLPPVVRLELPAALLLLALLDDVVSGRTEVRVTNAQAVAIAKFEQRIREAESRR